MSVLDLPRAVWDLVRRNDALRAEGHRRRRSTAIATPSLRHHRLYPLRSQPGGYEVRRDGQVVAGSHSGELEDLVMHYRERERREDDVRIAMDGGAPGDLCELGWHRTRGGGYFRVATAINPSVIIVYRVGAQPFDHRSTTVWSHGGQRLLCSVCNTPGFTDPKRHP